MKNMTFLRDHSCRDIEKLECIAIEQYWLDGKKRWFHSAKEGLHEIKYCPYCGLESVSYTHLDVYKRQVRDISEYTGYLPEEQKEWLKYLHIERTGCQYFSLSTCSITTAREYINTILDLSLIHI